MARLSDRPIEDTRLCSTLPELNRTPPQQGKEQPLWATPMVIYVYHEEQHELRVEEGTHLCYLVPLSEILRQIEY